jgi:hypothetical protein
MTAGMRALNRLAKWRAILTGWQLGTREKGDPTSDAVRDHREVTLLLRAEVSALVMLLIEKGVFTAEEIDQQLVIEAQHLERGLEKRFPGARASDDGMHLDTALVTPWMSKFPQ